jgi:hypothetical protein
MLIGREKKTVFRAVGAGISRALEVVIIGRIGKATATFRGPKRGGLVTDPGYNAPRSPVSGKQRSSR